MPCDAACAVCASEATISGCRGLIGHHRRADPEAGHRGADEPGERDRVVVELLGQPDLADADGSGASRLGDGVIDEIGGCWIWARALLRWAYCDQPAGAAAAIPCCA